MAPDATPLPVAAVAALSAELCALKRIFSAAHAESIANRHFRRAWSALVAGEDCSRVACAVTADALAALRLGGIDAAMLARIGVDEERAHAILAAAVAEPMPGAAPFAAFAGTTLRDGIAPAFVDALARQPRAGATRPGRPRIILQPAETHGDHCLCVAVLGVLLAPAYGADAATVFLIGLAHHFHNAVLPDSGFTGEVLLGDALAPALERLFEEALAALPGPLAARTRDALAACRDAETPEGRAFNAADVIDRVQEMRHFERVAAFTAREALDDMELVHAGPLQTFHHAVLRKAGLC